MRKCVDGQLPNDLHSSVEQLRNTLVVRKQAQEDDDVVVGRNAERRSQGSNLGVILGPGPKKVRVHGIGQCEQRPCPPGPSPPTAPAPALSW